MSKTSSKDARLVEGELYVVRDGVLQRIHRDPHDSLRKIRITDEVFEEIVALQRKMRPHLDGYKPDLTMVCSALLHQAVNNSQAVEWIKKFTIQYLQSRLHGTVSG